jgi:hypothetical protein
MPGKRTSSRRGFNTPGRRLFDAVMADFELYAHEVELLTQAAHTADLMDQLQKQVDHDGVLSRQDFKGTSLRISVLPASGLHLVKLLANRVEIGA